MNNMSGMIDIYDDVFSYHEILNNYEFIRSACYRPVGGDDTIYKDDTQIASGWSVEDAYNFGWFNTEFHKMAVQKYNLREDRIRQIRINLTTPAERNRIHTDSNGVTLLYYANPKWELDWGGHTLIMDKHLKEVEKVVLYKPGRICIFDGSLPHMIMTPSNLCPQHRYTFVIQYKGEE